MEKCVQAAINVNSSRHVNGGVQDEAFGSLPSGDNLQKTALENDLDYCDKMRLLMSC